MKKSVSGALSAVAFVGLAACSTGNDKNNLSLADHMQGCTKVWQDAQVRDVRDIGEATISFHVCARLDATTYRTVFAAKYPQPDGTYIIQVQRAGSAAYSSAPLTFEQKTEPKL